jgi:hypothetical protein
MYCSNDRYSSTSYVLLLSFVEIAMLYQRAHIVPNNPHKYHLFSNRSDACTSYHALISAGGIRQMPYLYIKSLVNRNFHEDHVLEQPAIQCNR